MARPFDRQALSHHRNAGLRHRRGHDERTARPHPGRENAYYTRLALVGDPALAAGVAHVERAVQHDIRNGVEGARAEVLGLGNEIARGVVDQTIERPGRPDLLDHFLDRRGHRISTVWLSTRRAGILGHDLPGGFLEDAAAAAANHAIGAQLDELLHHRLAQPGAATGDQKPFALEQIRLEHRFRPLCLRAAYIGCLLLSPPYGRCTRWQGC